MNRNLIAIPVRARFGHLVVTGVGTITKRMRKVRGKVAPITDVRWKCRCDCGNEIEAWPANLKSGRTTTCGHTQNRAPRGFYGPVCSADGCEEKHAAWGFCTLHAARYANRRRVGDSTPVEQLRPRPRPSVRIDLDMLLSLGHLNDREAAKVMGIANSTVSRHRRRMGIPPLSKDTK